MFQRLTTEEAAPVLAEIGVALDFLSERTMGL
jgi:hypothetical protein